MNSKLLLALCVVITVAAAAPDKSGSGWAGWPPAGGANPWIPPWVSSASWYPQWAPCTTVGVSCLDCKTKVICTKIGGIKKACSDPALPHCNLGECSDTPSEGCAVPEDPANAS